MVRAWPVRTSDAVALACRRAGRNLSPTEWEEFLSFLAPSELCQGIEAEPWTESAQLDPPKPSPPVSHDVRDKRPTIYYFEAVPGSTLHPGEDVTLRWDGAGATKVYLEYAGQRHDVTSPNEELSAPTEDTTYRLVLVSGTHERIATLTISIEGE
jgi:hypothetical protein